MKDALIFASERVRVLGGVADPVRGWRKNHPCGEVR